MSARMAMRRLDGPPVPSMSTAIPVPATARAFGRPVLVMHGDQHTLEIETFRDTQLRPVPNVLRLQLMGEARVHGVSITVDPDTPGVFSFAPLIVPGNGPL